MVAEINGRIIGHIMFTEARVNEKTVLVTIMKDLENMRVLNEVEEDKVAGSVPILHPGHHYDPPAAPEEPQEGGAEGTW